MLHRSLRPFLAILSATLLVLAGCAGSGPSRNEPSANPSAQVGGGAPSPPAIAPGSASPGLATAASPGPSPAVSGSPSPGLVAATPSPSIAGDRFSVQILPEHRFSPQPLTIPRGATVRWHNADSVAHTVTADFSKVLDPSHVALPEGAPPFDSGELPPQGEWEYTFTIAGLYQYVCQIHENEGMTGEIIVTP